MQLIGLKDGVSMLCPCAYFSVLYLLDELHNERQGACVCEYLFNCWNLCNTITLLSRSFFLNR